MDSIKTIKMMIGATILITLTMYLNTQSKINVITTKGYHDEIVFKTENHIPVHTLVSVQDTNKLSKCVIPE